MKYPTFELLAENQTGKGDNFQELISMVASSIDLIYDKNEVHNSEDSTKEELEKFVYSMNQKQLGMVQEFFETMPVLRHTIKYTCPECGCEEVTEIKEFQNFFL